VWELQECCSSTCDRFTWSNKGFQGGDKILRVVLTFWDCFFFFYLLFSFNLENHDDPKKINATLQLVFSSNLVYVLVISIFLFKIIYKIRIVFQFHPHGFFLYVKFGSCSFNCYIFYLKWFFIFFFNFILLYFFSYQIWFLFFITIFFTLKMFLVYFFLWFYPSKLNLSDAELLDWARV